MAEYDVIVVGGGPGGSTAARRAALKGLNVLLLDKEEFPRIKPCGGAMNPTLERTLDFSVEEVVHRRPHGFKMFSPSGLVVDGSQPKPSGIMVMREEFDHLLLRKAEEAGVEVQEGQKVIGAEHDSKGVSVLTKGGEIHTGSYLIGADGINSTVAKSLGFYQGWSKDSAAITIEIEAEVGKEAVERICGVPGEKGRVTFDIYLGAVQFGYGWCFPKKTILSMGLGGRQDKIQNLRGAFNKWLEEFKKKHEIDPEVISDTAARVPYSGAAPRTAFGRTLLVGDAAGFVNPFDQEGAVMAVQSGVIAATILEQAVQTSNAQALRGYEEAWKDEFGDVLKVGKNIAKMLFKNEKNMEIICRMASEDQVIRDIVFRLIECQDSYSSLYRSLIKRVLTKHPKSGLSLYI